MSCKFDEKIIHLYADNELGETARARVEQHLSICDNCREKDQTIAAIKESLHSSCANVKAPGHLRTRILANLDNAAGAEGIEFGLLDRFRLMILNMRNSRAIAAGFVFGLALLFVLFPGKQGLGKMAGMLAQEHVKIEDPGDALFISTAAVSEAEEFLNNQLGMLVSIPESFELGMQLQGAGIVDLNGMKAAQIRYADKKTCCSLFVFKDPDPDHKLQYSIRANGKEFEVSTASDVNLICWHRGELAYVLCGCCCFNTLTKLATSVI